jgi:hypothetical protein
MIKLICTDLDGTLLRDDKTISSFSLEVLKKAKQAGLKIVPVTGRHFDGIDKKILDIGLDFAICSNGAALYDLKKNICIREECIDSSIIKKYLDLFEEYDVMSDFFIEKKAYTDSRNLDVLKDVNATESVKNYIKNSRINLESIKDFYLQNNPSVQKITLNFRYINGKYKNKEKLRKELEKNPLLSCVTGGANNLEITSSLATKGECIRFLSKYCGIPVSEIMSIGDTENDLSMLSATGYSVAMGNADDNVKALCDYITDTNENNGAAKAIERIINNNEIN